MNKRKSKLATCLVTIAGVALASACFVVAQEVDPLFEPLLRPGVEVEMDGGAAPGCGQQFSAGRVYTIGVIPETACHLYLFIFMPDQRVEYFWPIPEIFPSTAARLNGGSLNTVPFGFPGGLFIASVPGEYVLLALATEAPLTDFISFELGDPPYGGRFLTAETHSEGVALLTQALAALPSNTWWAGGICKYTVQE